MSIPALVALPSLPLFPVLGLVIASSDSFCWSLYTSVGVDDVCRFEWRWWYRNRFKFPHCMQYLPSCLLSLPLPSFHLHIFWFKQCQGPVRLDPTTLHHHLFRWKLSSMSSPQRLSSQSSFSSFDSVAQGWRCSTYNMFVTPQVQLLQSHSCQLSAFGMPLTNVPGATCIPQIQVTEKPSPFACESLASCYQLRLPRSWTVTRRTAWSLVAWKSCFQGSLYIYIYIYIN